MSGKNPFISKLKAPKSRSNPFVKGVKLPGTKQAKSKTVVKFKAGAELASKV